MKRLALPLLVSVLWTTEAFALPQLSTMAGRRCDNCHVDPYKWENPDVELRKCSLSCGTCHINPTGGGLRSTAGSYYGREILPTFGFRPSDGATVARPASRPASQPGTLAAAAVDVPGPGSDARYAGMTANPWIRAGADLRAMYFAPFGEGRDDSFLLMQSDLYLAASPYNPKELNKGRLTLVLNGGVLGRRENTFDDIPDRIFLREWWALFHDLPYQAYAKVGQFLPAFGWRLDDHTPFIRQSQSFNNERQVTGLEIGINPNYLYAHASIFAPGPLNNRGVGGNRNRALVLLSRDSPDAPWTAFDTGWGTALTAGWRDLWWQAGGSLMVEDRPGFNSLWAGANWSLNFHDALHPWTPLRLAPIVYLGEFDFTRQGPDDGRAANGLASYHELNAEVFRGVFALLRYDWQDPDLEIRDDHRHRYTFGVSWHPYTFVELIAQYRHNAEPAGVDNDEALIQIHAWF